MDKDIKKHPGMTNWFNPSLLLDVGREAIISAIFGKYADRRLIRSTLGSNIDEAKASDFSDKIINDGAIWVDYVADVGDGFNSTYSVAYLLGQKKLSVGQEYVLPRGDLLIMGGDEVYPKATHYDYKWRMELPYTYSFPDSNEVNAPHPPVFMLPGNHDWYDGLTLFLAKFCRGPGDDEIVNKLKGSSWSLHQYRSYFAIKLPQDWWIFGIDTQLCEDIDKPQEEYFVNIMKNESSSVHQKIILCCAEPTWIKNQLKDDVGRSAYSTGIHHFAVNVVKKYWPDSKIYAVISGDSHHYSRYSNSDGTQFITAGGGGAFLHPTHHLEDSFLVDWGGSQDVRFNLKKAYPDSRVSRKLVLKNWKFPFRNIKFCLLLGVMYFVISLFLIAWGKYFPSEAINGNAFDAVGRIFMSLALSPASLITAVIFMYVFYKYDSKDSLNKNGNWIGAIHGLIQILMLLLVISVLPILFNKQSQFLCSITWSEWCPRDVSLFILMPTVIFLDGLIGGFIFGLYLIATSFFYKRQCNDSFSAMRLDTYKNFLRIKIENDVITIYPFGIDTPSRDWKKNNSQQSGSKYVPSRDIKYHLIEDPIVVRK